MKKACIVSAAALAALAGVAEPTVYTHLMNPRLHPDDARREAKPPSWETLGNKTHFMALRHAKPENFKRYIDEDKLGDFVWSYWTYFLKDERQLDRFIAEVKKSDDTLSPCLEYYQERTKAQHAFQVVLDAPYVQADCFSRTTPVAVPARTFLSQLF